jgi:hypothetical protein
VGRGAKYPERHGLRARSVQGDRQAERGDCRPRDPFKEIRNFNEGIAVRDPFKDIRKFNEEIASLDLFEGYRELTDQLTPSAVANWAQGLAPAVSSPLDEILRDFETTLEDDSLAEPGPLSGWLRELPPPGQRRLFLLALTALCLIADAADAFAAVNPLAHMDKVIPACSRFSPSSMS